MRLRMRLFFPPQFRVGVEPVAGPLPRVAQPVDLAADGVFGEQRSAVLSQVLQEQGDGPGGGRIAEVLGAPGQQLPEQVPLGLTQQGWPPGAVAVGQGSGAVLAGIGVQPVIDGPGRHPQPTRDRGDGLPRGDFKDGEGPAVHPGVACGAQLLLQAPSLPVPQGQGIHWTSSLSFRLPAVASV